MKLILIIFSFFIIYPFFSQTEIFNEDFQQGIPNNWIISDQDFLQVNNAVSEYDQAWIYKIDPNNLDDTVASSTSFFSSPGQANRWLISPQITLGSFGNFLTWESKSFDPSYPEDFKVLISNTNNEISSFTDTLDLIIAENYMWTNHEVNISEKGYDNQTVYIAFVLNTDDGFKFFLDDVKIRKEDPLAISKIDPTKFNFYPNPIVNELYLKNQEEIKSITIYSLSTEQIVLQINNINSKIDLSHLKEGVYSMKIETKKGEIITKKIIKI